MNDLVSMYNKYRLENKSTLRKALDSTSGSALSPQNIEKNVTEAVVRIRPEYSLVTPVSCPSLTKSFNRRTSLPSSVAMLGDGAVTPTDNSTYVRATADLKIFRKKGAVTNFLRDSSRTLVDAQAIEMEGHLTAFVYGHTTLMLHGNSAADPYSFNGWDMAIATNRYNYSSSQGGTQMADLTVLDTMIDKNRRLQGAMHRKVLLMSPELLSRTSHLLTNVRLVQGLSGAGLTQVDIGGGWRLNAYRDVPIVETTQTRPMVQMGTVTATPGGSGSLTGSHFYFQVSAVTIDGESLASAEVDAGSATSNNIVLAWTAVSGAFFYKIYYSGTTATEKLLQVVAARAYDAAGTPGAATTGYTVTSLTPDASVYDATHGIDMRNDIPKTGSLTDPPEDIYLIDLDIIQGMGELAYSNGDGSRFNGLVSTQMLAMTDDFLPFMVKCYSTIVPSFEATSIKMSNIKA